MKRFLLLNLIILFSLAAIGQSPKDTLILKNGSVVYGTILKRSAHDISIRTVDGLLFIFSTGEIQKFSSRSVPEDSPRDRETEGLSFMMDFGIPIGGSEQTFPIHFSFNPVMDYKFNRMNSLGIGSGLELWENLMMPVFIEYRANFSEKNFTPFLFIRAGWLINLKSDESDSYADRDYMNGWTLGTGLGFLWPLGRIESFVKIGYRYTYFRNIESYNYGGYPNRYDERFKLNCFEVRWGFTF